LAFFKATIIHNDSEINFVFIIQKVTFNILFLTYFHFMTHLRQKTYIIITMYRVLNSYECCDKL